MNKDIKNFKKAVKKLLKKIKKDKKFAKQFLIEIGIITKKGNIRKKYKNTVM